MKWYKVTFDAFDDAGAFHKGLISTTEAENAFQAGLKVCEPWTSVHDVSVRLIKEGEQNEL